ncbi:MAG: transposase, partial [Candidatus Freyarchaeota archaeon]|nr:transposase [Candidatus Jordarchaeia archaeon]
MQRNRQGRRNQRRGEADWRFLVSLVRGWAPVVEVSPGYTSKTCSRCGEVNKAL